MIYLYENPEDFIEIIEYLQNEYNKQYDTEE